MTDDRPTDSIGSSDYDFADVQKVGEQLEGFITEKLDHTTTRVLLHALVLLVGQIVCSIECPGCRRIANDWVKKEIPAALRIAMTEAAKRPKQSQHVH
jgi:hypothetical protein